MSWRAGGLGLCLALLSSSVLGAAPQTKDQAALIQELQGEYLLGDKAWGAQIWAVSLTQRWELKKIEFQLPFLPDKQGLERANSGVYLQNRYEIQVLDSFGLLPGCRDSGSLCTVEAPAINLSFPPLQWQTFDIDFTAARFDANLRKIAYARLSLDMNGVRVLTDLEIRDSTPGGE